mmetsp:Transcript_78763/g.217783  ORF Transcript_78763/g.217783 Transcript_78763/m.217783 type:complete len:391 (-) Transcript_78763:1595-2767(-)
MVVVLVLGNVRHGHVRVPNRLHLEHSVRARERIKLGVQAVQHARDLPWLQGGSDVGEAHDVGEEDGHHLTRLRLDLLAAGERVGHVPREDVVEQVVRTLRALLARLLSRAAAGHPIDQGAGAAVGTEGAQAAVQLLGGGAHLRAGVPAVAHEHLHVRATGLGDVRPLSLLHDRSQDLLGVLSGVGVLARAHLVQQDAERVHVRGGRVAACAPEELRRHPVGRSASADLLLLREAEVGDLGAEARVHQHVLRLEVAVHDDGLGGVQEPQALRNVAEDGQHQLVLDGDRVVVQDVVERAVLHQLHDEHGLHRGGDHGAHDRCHAGMPHLGERAHLADEILPQPVALAPIVYQPRAGRRARGQAPKRSEAGLVVCVNQVDQTGAGPDLPRLHV